MPDLKDAFEAAKLDSLAVVCGVYSGCELARLRSTAFSPSDPRFFHD